MKKPKFAERIFVKWMDESDEPWRSVEDTAEAFAEMDEDVSVGEYKLLTVRKVKTRIEIS